MLKIGLTGSAGSGKSTVAGMFKHLGAIVISADEVCHQLFVPCQKTYHEIVHHFGQVCLNADGTLNRDFLRKRLLSSSEDKNALENILHPEIQTKIMQQLEEIKKSVPESVVVIEVPLLFEAGWEQMFDLIITVYADKKTCLLRLQQRGLTKADAEGLLSLGWPIQEKIKRADIVIDNSQDLTTTKKQVETIWKKLKGN
ncbi:MAG: dephospho-CoA kinase [Candidatus Desulfofervidaceae bacterium]|nr:dephospho-CoA kinase [Candidatus Desulfofervidaceae bacterium]